VTTPLPPSTCVGEREYLIMSVKHTRPGDRWITFWRPNDAGYAYRMDWCGRYPEATVRAHSGYYDSIGNTFAVPADYVLPRAIESSDGSGRGLRVPNTPRMWRKMVRAAARARLDRRLHP
jgi:hypothetical protein